MELDGFNEEIKLPTQGKKKAYEVDYEDLTQQAVENLMQADVDHITALFGVDVRTLSVISCCPLPCFCWYFILSYLRGCRVRGFTTMYRTSAAQ